MCPYRGFPRPRLILATVIFTTFTAASPDTRANPAEVIVGLNRTLEVECFYRQGSLPSFTGLFSLVMTHSSKSKKSNFIHLVTVSSSNGLINSTQLKHPFTTSGVINNNNNVSYVKISWEFPRKNKAGLYTCEAHGHDVKGRPVSASSSTTVKAKSMSRDVVLLEIRGLRDYLDNLQMKWSNLENNFTSQIGNVSYSVNQLQIQVSSSEDRHLSVISSIVNTVSSLQSRFANLDSRTSQVETYQNNMKNNMDVSKQAISNIESNLNAQIRSILSTVNEIQNHVSNSDNRFRTDISSLSSTVSNLQSRVSNLEMQTSAIKTHQDKTKKNLEASKQTMFTSSGYYQGRRYWLTRSTSFFNPGYAQLMCMMHGGYLAEVDNSHELQFMQSWVRSYGRQYNAVMLGGTDEGHERTWLHMYSRTSVPSLWYRGQPDNYEGKEHCLCLWRKFDYAMNDAPCYVTNSNEVGFVCEIPE